MNKKMIIFDVIEIFIWIFLFTCVIGSGYLIWHYGWMQ